MRKSLFILFIGWITAVVYGSNCQKNNTYCPNGGNGPDCIYIPWKESSLVRNETEIHGMLRS